MTVYTKRVVSCDRSMCPKQYEDYSDADYKIRVNAFDNRGFVQRNGHDYCREHGAEIDQIRAVEAKQ